MEKNYIGIDIGGTNLRLALITASGRILSRIRFASVIAEGRNAFCDRLLAGIAEMRAFAESLGLAVSGIGAGVPGLVSSDGVIISSVNMRPLDGLNLAGYLESANGIPAVCGNDANMIAMGEYIYGAGAAFKSMMVISIGTGLGSGLILNGCLWTGTGGFASEFGHITVQPDGLPCPCGNKGCLEQYVSAGAIVRYAMELLPEGPGKSDFLPDAAKIGVLAKNGDAAAQKAFEIAGSWLGIALSSLANTLNLEAVVVCGGVSDSFGLLLPSMRKELRQRCFQEVEADLKIIAGTQGDDAGLLGAAGMVRESGI